MMTISDHFAALLDPVAILSACAQSGALNALPVSAKRSADRISHNVVLELAEHDAAVDELYRQLIAKASKTSPAKSKEMVRGPRNADCRRRPGARDPLGLRRSAATFYLDQTLGSDNHGLWLTSARF
jgi:hypothetical protein